MALILSRSVQTPSRQISLIIPEQRRRDSTPNMYVYVYYWSKMRSCKVHLKPTFHYRTPSLPR